MARTGVADAAVFGSLARGPGAFRVKYPGHGRHVEADISRQVLALIGRAGRSSASTRSPGARPRRRRSSARSGSTARISAPTPLGMVDATYFHGGYAIHGYARSRPTTPATAACGCRSRRPVDLRLGPLRDPGRHLPLVSARRTARAARGRSRRPAGPGGPGRPRRTHWLPEPSASPANGESSTSLTSSTTSRGAPWAASRARSSAGMGSAVRDACCPAIFSVVWSVALRASSMANRPNPATTKRLARTEKPRRREPTTRVAYAPMDAQAA